MGNNVRLIQYQVGTYLPELQMHSKSIRFLLTFGRMNLPVLKLRISLVLTSLKADSF